ncbi:MAG TPA: GAF domain-containing protein, partial [Allocoleopsis sp.]
MAGPLQAQVQTQAQELHLAHLEQAPIQFHNQIQPHGVLLVLTPDLKILQVTNNTLTVFGIAPEEILQKNLDELLDPFQVERIKAGLVDTNLELINPIKIWTKNRQKGDDYFVFDGIFHRSSDDLLILELEPAISQENIPFLSFYHLARASINQLESTASLQEFCQTIVQEVRQVTGFDRVMLYKFDHDGHGVVLAEEKLDHLESYLGLHYPESDIPKAARKLFASNWIRIIPDTHAEAIAL